MGGIANASVPLADYRTYVYDMSGRIIKTFVWENLAAYTPSPVHTNIIEVLLYTYDDVCRLVTIVDTYGLNLGSSDGSQVIRAVVTSTMTYNGVQVSTRNTVEQTY